MVESNYAAIGRTKNLVRMSAVSGAVRLVGMALSLAAIPAYVLYFVNQDELGHWFVLLVVVSWVLSLDLGIGNGLRHHAVRPLADADWSRLRELIASAYLASAVMVCALGAAFFLLIAAARGDYPLHVIFGSATSASLPSAIVAVLVGLLAQFVLRVITALLMADQRPLAAASINAVTNGLIVAYLWAALSFGWSRGLVQLGIAYGFAVNLPLIAASIWLFATRLRLARPRLSDASWSAARLIVSVGVGFFALQAAFMFLSTLNPILISRQYGSADVVAYSILSRPFQAALMLCTMLLAPVWSAVTLAAVQHDVEWISRTWRRLGVGALVCGFAVVVAGLSGLQQVVDIWIGADAPEASIFSRVALGVGFLLALGVAAISAVANGTGLIRSQLTLFALGLTLKIAFVVAVASDSNRWEWVVVSDIAGFAPYVLVQPILLRRHLLRLRTEVALLS